MKSKWSLLKEKAVNLRKRGKSIREVEFELGIPRSTLSGWFKHVALSEFSIKRLRKRSHEALVKARILAVQWHNKQKALRLIDAENNARTELAKVNIRDRSIINLAFAMLYLGEGAKKKPETSLGNSDPLILKLFVSILTKYYGIDSRKIRCSLHLRADQNENEMKKYWASQLKLHLSNFTAVSKDKRTIGTKTYPTYKGVCVVSCGEVAIQRKLLYLSKIFCEKVITGG